MFRFARAIRLRNLIACCTFMNLCTIRSVAVNERNPLKGWSVLLLLPSTNSRRRLMKNNFIRSGKTGYGGYAMPSWRSTWETLEKKTSIFCRECYFSLPRLVSRICRHLTSHNHIISAHLLLVYNIEKTKKKNVNLRGRFVREIFFERDFTEIFLPTYIVTYKIKLALFFGSASEDDLENSVLIVMIL